MRLDARLGYGYVPAFFEYSPSFILLAPAKDAFLLVGRRALMSAITSGALFGGGTGLCEPLSYFLEAY